MENELTTIPESVGNLKSLIRLYLMNNKITSLPESLLKLELLEDLDLKNNPILNDKENHVLENLKNRDVLIY